MKLFLKVIFTGILAVMLYATVSASMDRNVFQALRELGPDLWFQATLWDTYFAFFTICLWVIYKEKSVLAKCAWSLGILLLGNFVIAGYVLIQLFCLKPDEPVSAVLTKRN